MKEINFRFPSNPYDKDWAIECVFNGLTDSLRSELTYVRRGDNVLKALGYDGYYSISLPYDCLLTWGNPIDGYDPHGRMFDAYECEVYLYYFD